MTDRFDQIRRDVEREFVEKELARFGIGPPDSPVTYSLRGVPLVRLTNATAQKMIRAEYAEGVRGMLRTREAVCEFLDRHQIPYETLEDSAHALGAS